MVKVGDIFYESWGYDQTNIDFAIVVSVSPTGKTALCRMMGKERVDEWNVKPTQPYGIAFRLHVRVYSNEEHLVGKYPFIQTSYPACKLFKRDSNEPFQCVRNYDVKDYRFWTGDKKQVWCEGCVNFFEEPSIDFRDGGLFHKYEKPIYETPTGMGH